MLAASTAFIALLASGFVFVDLHWAHKLSHEAFGKLCHQFPFRSFELNGRAMAVCSRCFGLYSGFFGAALVGVAALRHMTLSLKTTLLLAACMVALNFIDVAGNFIGVWTNTEVSRYFTGLFAGVSLILIIFTAYNHHPNK